MPPFATEQNIICQVVQERGTGSVTHVLWSHLSVYDAATGSRYGNRKLKYVQITTSGTVSTIVDSFDLLDFDPTSTDLSFQQNPWNQAPYSFGLSVLLQTYQSGNYLLDVLETPSTSSPTWTRTRLPLPVSGYIAYDYGCVVENGITESAYVLSTNSFTYVATVLRYRLNDLTTADLPEVFYDIGLDPPVELAIKSPNNYLQTISVGQNSLGGPGMVFYGAAIDGSGGSLFYFNGTMPPLPPSSGSLFNVSY
jgi:hypothetical protein